MEFADAGEQGAFNQGIAYLERLDRILRMLNEASLNDDYATKFKCLKIFYKELYPMMSDKDKDTLKKQFEEVKNKYNNYLDDLRNRKKTTKAENLEILDEWEIKLRECMHSKGMLMPKKDDPRYALK